MCRGSWRAVAERRKPFFLPEARECGPVSTPAPEPEPAPEEPAGRYACPCCGYLTFRIPIKAAVAFICPVCYWENDVFDPGEDDPSDENGGMTLRQGRENFKQCGAVRPDLVRYARPPRPGEIPKKSPENWG